MKTILKPGIHMFNDFTHVRNAESPLGTRMAYGLRIYCSSCTRNEVWPVPGGKPSCNQPVANSMFRAKGWETGRNRKSDVCSECQQLEASKREQARRQRLGLPPPPITKMSEELLKVFGPKPVTEPVTPPKHEELTVLDTPTLNPQTSAADEAISKERRNASLREKFAIKAKLDEVLFMRQGFKDVYVYKTGWNDELVAKSIDAALSGHHVAYVRIELFGKLYVASPPSPEQRIKELEERVAFLEKSLGVQP